MKAAWAKLRRNCKEGRGPYCRNSCDCLVTGRLSLVGHSADVAAVMQALLEQLTIARRLATLLGKAELTLGDCARLTALAALHDMGKVNNAFQNAPFQKQPGGAGHIKPLLALLDKEALRPLVERGGLSGLLHLLALQNQNDAPLPFCAVMAHHGYLPPVQSGDNRREIWSAARGFDPGAACRELVDAVRHWCPAAFEPVQIAWTHPFEHAFAGLLTLADWIGSDDEHFEYPEDGAPDGPGRFAWGLPRARALLASRGLAPEQARQRAACVLFTSEVLTGFVIPSAAQAAMLRLPTAPGGRTCLIEDETGSGKTEAALIHFMDLFRRGAVDGMYFALPTRAAARSIHARIAAALRKLLGGDAPPVILAVPGYVPGTLPNAALPDASVLWPDEAALTARDRVWAAERPKRFLAGWVAVGTIDQVLMGGLQVRHAQLRSGALLRLLLVVDEVHASDTYMARILCNLLQQHRRAGGHALLMSATLGSAARARLLGASSRAPPPEPAAAIATPYPATWSDDAADEPLPEPERETAGKPVQMVLEPDWSDNRAVVQRALAAARRGARVLVIRNTVRSVVAMQQALEAEAPGLVLAVAGASGTVRAPHHARFAAEDRTRLDAALDAVLGKHAPREHGSIACASQTAEQSLDIDADLLITDLCPADVLLQRMGRLHRHRDRTRPAGFENATCVVLAPGEDELAGSIRPDGEVGNALLGLGLVYPALTGVVATRRILAQAGSITIPADNRRLVEEATHPDLLRNLTVELGGCWPGRWEHEVGQTGAHARVAQRACLDWCKPTTPLPPLDERITTRLGLDDWSVEMPGGTLGPFGHEVSRVTVPGRWLRGVAPKAAVVVERETGDTLRLTIGDRRFIYDRFGLRPA